MHLLFLMLLVVLVLKGMEEVGSTCGKGFSLGRVTFLWLLLKEALKELRKILDVDEAKGKAQEQRRKNIIRGQKFGINVVYNRAIQFVPQLSSKTLVELLVR